MGHAKIGHSLTHWFKWLSASIVPESQDNQKDSRGFKKRRTSKHAGSKCDLSRDLIKGRRKRQRQARKMQRIYAP